MSIRHHLPHTLLALAALSALSVAPLAHAGVTDAICPGLGNEAEPTRPRYELFYSPYTHHWTYSPEHRTVHALSLSRRLENGRFCGFSLFNNSFGQPSAYVFVGKEWEGLFPSVPRLSLGVSGGIIYGYVGRFKDKVPLNVGGFAPAVIPSVSWRLTDQAALQVQLLGTAAIMVGGTWRF